MTMMRRAIFTSLVTLCVATSFARAQVTYQVDGWPPSGTTTYEIFNNSVGTETEDCWVANSFTAQAGGNRLNSLTFALGNANPSVPTLSLTVTATLYTGSSLTTPSGLSRIVASTNTVNLTNATTGSLQTIPFAAPIDLPVGQIFYAAILIRGVNGSTFPFVGDLFTPGPSPTNQLRSFFDVGPTQGGAYNLDNTANATRLGLNHPVLGGAAQSQENLVLRVNGTAVPEPTSLALAGLGLAGFTVRRWRRR